jgi:hypothetical protein
MQAAVLLLAVLVLGPRCAKRQQQRRRQRGTRPHGAVGGSAAACGGLSELGRGRRPERGGLPAAAALRAAARALGRRRCQRRRRRAQPGCGARGRELFVRHCLCGSTAAKRIGVLLLPQAGDISRAPATAEEAAEEPGAAIISRTGETLLVAVAVSPPLPYAAAQPPPASMVAAAGRSRPPVGCVGRLTLCVCGVPPC